jgi:hypothetical protein
MGRLLDGFGAINLGAGVEQALNAIIDTFNFVMDNFKTHVWDVMKGIGKDIIGGLVNAIRESAQKLREALDWIASIAPQWVKDALGIGSPSKVFEEIGRNVMAGWTKGIEDMAMGPQMALAGATGGMVGGAGGVTTNNNRTTNWNVTVPSSGRTERLDESIPALVNTLQAAYG